MSLETAERRTFSARLECRYLLRRLCDWINAKEWKGTDEDRLALGVVRAVLAHLYFAWIHPFSDGTAISSNLFDGAIRVFLGRIFWLEGGIGIGYVNQSDEFGFVFSSGVGLGLMGAAGVEVLQTYNFALDLQLRISGARIENNPGVNVGNVAALIGIHWY